MSPLLTLLLGLLAGLGGGYVLFRNLERRKTGGKTAAELMQEHETYRQEVQQHFGKTSDLFQSMTVQYRELYDHLAQGARSLCDTTQPAPVLDLENKALLPQQQDADEEPQVEPSTSEPDDQVSDDDVPVAGSGEDDEDLVMGADASISVQEDAVDQDQAEPAASEDQPDADRDDEVGEVSEKKPAA